MGGGRKLSLRFSQSAAFLPFVGRCGNSTLYQFRQESFRADQSRIQGNRTESGKNLGMDALMISRLALKPELSGQYCTARLRFSRAHCFWFRRPQATPMLFSHSHRLDVDIIRPRAWFRYLFASSGASGVNEQSRIINVGVCFVRKGVQGG